jgi:hypothetical protein
MLRASTISSFLSTQLLRMYKIFELSKMNRQQDQHPSTRTNIDDSNSPWGFNFGDFLIASNTHSSRKASITKKDISDGSHATTRSTNLFIFHKLGFGEFSSMIFHKSSKSSNRWIRWSDRSTDLTLHRLTIQVSLFRPSTIYFFHAHKWPFISLDVKIPEDLQ